MACPAYAGIDPSSCVIVTTRYCLPRVRGDRPHKRGVRVRGMLDKSQLSERYSGATFLANAGVTVRINSRYAIMHNKFLVIDGQTV